MKRLLLLLSISIVSLSAQPNTASKVIHFKELQKFLPTAGPSGFTAEKPKGETVSASGFSTSSASINFTTMKKERQPQTNDDGSVDTAEVDVQWVASVQISDFSGMGEAAAASMAMLTAAEFENETESGYEKSVTVGKYKGIEKSTAEEYSKSCSLQLMVGGRFMISVNGQGFSDAALLRSIVGGMDLAKLEKSVSR